jgi:hypothetical protein
MAKKQLPPEVLEFFRKQGAKGGKKRASQNTPEKLSEWGKMGGRPKKADPKKGSKA